MEGASKWHKFSAGLLELWTAITPDCRVGSQRGLNQSCSPCRDLFNAMLHSQIGHREQVDSRLLVVRSQTASLTPGSSFAHNLGCRCPNCLCEGIFDIYVSRPFQWHQKHPNARCFAPCCRALNIRESRRTPTPNFSKCWASPPHLAKVGVRQIQSPIEFVGKWKGLLDKAIMTNLVIIEEQQIMLLLVTLPSSWRSFVTTQNIITNQTLDDLISEKIK